MLTKNCQYCGRQFVLPSREKYRKQKYCSLECYWDATFGLDRRRTLICQNCGKRFEVARARANTAKYCSRECCDTRHLIPLPEPNIDDAFGNWLAGFIDGEGCFVICKRQANKGSPSFIRPFFTLGLRADDRPIVDEIAERLGVRAKARLAKSKGPYPRVILALNSIADCLQLIKVLDHHPLRAKKLRDYVVWREAVFEKTKGAKQDLQRLLSLYDDIQAVRQYDAHRVFEP